MNQVHLGDADLVSEPGFDSPDGIRSVEFRYKRVRRVISKEYHILFQIHDIRNRLVILETLIIYLLHAAHLYFPYQMDPCAINIMHGTSVVAHISLFRASIIAHTQDPFSEFRSITVRAFRLLWSLPMVDSWVEFRFRYHHFMIMGNLGWDGPRFQAQGAQAIITSELLSQEEFEQRGITMETLQHVFPLHQAHSPPAPPALAQGPPSLPVPSTPQMPDGCREA